VGKGSAKPPRAGIGDIMAGVSLDPLPTAAGDAGARERGRDAQDARAPRHPIGSGVAFERVENIYRMDPRKVVLEGPYIRQFLEDADFHRLRASVELERDIGQHIGVRVVGPPTNQRRVLVYGMRRWRAALAVGLDKVPVRDYGPIGEEKAVELQMLENEIRADPHPIDTAIGFYLLSQQPEWSQKRISDVFDKNKGYVSEMVRVGEAIARLREVDRQPLYTCSRVTVRAFQSVAQVKSVEARKEALLALLDAQPAPADTPPPTDSGPTGASARRRSGRPGTSRRPAAGWSTRRSSTPARCGTGAPSACAGPTTTCGATGRASPRSSGRAFWRSTSTCCIGPPSCTARHRVAASPSRRGSPSSSPVPPRRPPASTPGSVGWGRAGARASPEDGA
jgi:ParB/RepB/Spo0J family partition protein